MSLFALALADLGGAACLEATGSVEPAIFKKILARNEHGMHIVSNTRAVPLVRKNDAHQGRVSFLPKFQATRKGDTA